jgi:hypothetical protein
MYRLAAEISPTFGMIIAVASFFLSQGQAPQPPGLAALEEKKKRQR